MTPVVGYFPSFSFNKARQNEKINNLFRGAILDQLPEF
jgi:hypothetical protein